MVKMGQKLSRQQKIRNALSRRRTRQKLQYAKTRATRPGRPLKPKRRPSTRTRLSLPKLVAKADKLLSLFIRARDGKCVLCGSVLKLTNGHLIKRGKKPVRWAEDNCFCLCSTCNYRDKVDTDYHGRYVAWYIARYGLPAYQALETRAKTPVDTAWIRTTCEEVIQKYG